MHVASSSGDDTPRVLELLRGARARGLDITTEAYPYTAGMTSIESVAFDDWRTWPDAKFGRLEWPPTGERLTRQTFARYRSRGGLVADHSNTEEVVRNAVAGTFARVLGRYVREERSLTLMDALRKMTLEPARRLEGRVASMRNKGRIREGADGDLVVFDPGVVIDRATYREPALAPEGIR